ncbi:MAG: hypothetical protein AB7I50_10030 [Vicinamibacterales bacterium]
MIGPRGTPAAVRDTLPWLTAPSVGTLALFVLLAVVHTWPLATAPSLLTRHDNADAWLNEWTLAWVAHAMVTQPWQIFDANIFYPARDSLAFSEHLIPQGLLGAPLAWMGGSPVLVFNLVLMAGFALTGWMTTVVVARWTGDWLAGAFAGSVAAFNTHTLSRMVHIQAVHVEFLALALFGLDRLLRSPRVRHVLWLAGWASLQMLCSGYLLVFTATTLAVGSLVRWSEWVGRGRGRVFVRLAWAAVLCALLCGPFLLPYARVRREQQLTRSLQEVAAYSAHWQDYLTTVGNVHYSWWSARFYRGTDALFPGVLPIALTGVAVMTGIAWRDRRARMASAAVVACLILSFGPATPVYRLLYAGIPLLEGIRGAARFGYVVIFGLGILGAFGLADARKRMRRQGGRVAAGSLLASVLVGAVNLEALVAPHDFVAFAGPSPVFRVLSERAVVVELPLWPPADIARNAPYLLNSTRAWYRLVNGYSGFVPAQYGALATDMRAFPDETSREALERLGATHVVVHLDELPGLAERLASETWLEQVAGARDVRIFRIRAVP